MNTLTGSNGNGSKGDLLLVGTVLQLSLIGKNGEQVNTGRRNGRPWLWKPWKLLGRCLTNKSCNQAGRGHSFDNQILDLTTFSMPAGRLPVIVNCLRMLKDCNESRTILT